MDLSEIIVPADLQPKPIVTCVVEGHLEESDLRELALSTRPSEADNEADDNPADLKKIREKHHSVARMVASGLTQRMISQLCGYTESYLSILLNNPAMQELVEMYRIQQGAGSQIIAERLRTVGLKALEKLETAIEGGKMSNQELLSASKLGLDRSGHGPQSTQHVVQETHIIDHAEIMRRNEDARARSASRIVPSAEIRALAAPVETLPQETTHDPDREVGEETP